MTVIVKLQVLLLPHSSNTVHVAKCVPIDMLLMTKLFPKEIMFPADDCNTNEVMSLQRSSAIGLGTLTLAKQYQKSVPTVISVGHVRIGPSVSVNLMICMLSTISMVHQSRTVHVLTILRPPPHSCNSLSQ